MAITASRSFNAPSGGTIGIKVNTGFEERTAYELKGRYENPNATPLVPAPDGSIVANNWTYINPCPIEFEVDLTDADFDCSREFDPVADGFVNDTPDWEGNPSTVIENGAYPKGKITRTNTNARYVEQESWYDPTMSRLQVFWSFGEDPDAHWEPVKDYLPAEYSQKDRDTGAIVFHTYADAPISAGAAGVDYTVRVMCYEPSSGKVSTATTTVNVVNYLFNADKIILVNNAKVVDGGTAANEDFSAFTDTHNELLAEGWTGEVIERNLMPFLYRESQEPETLRTKFGREDGGDYSATGFVGNPYNQYRQADNTVWLFKGNDEPDAPEYLFGLDRFANDGKAQVFGSYGAGRAKIDNKWNERILDGDSTWDDETLELTLNQTRFINFWVKGSFNPKTDMVVEGAERGAMGGYSHKIGEGHWVMFYNCFYDSLANNDGVYKANYTGGTGLVDNVTPGCRISLVSHEHRDDGGEYTYLGLAHLDVLGTLWRPSPESLARVNKMHYQDGPDTTLYDFSQDPPVARTPDDPFVPGEYLYDISQTSPDGLTYVRAKIIKFVDSGTTPWSNQGGARSGYGFVNLGRVLDQDGNAAVFSKGPEGGEPTGGLYESSVGGVYTNGSGVTCTIELQPGDDQARFSESGTNRIRNSSFRSSNTFTVQHVKSRYFHLGPDGQVIHKLGNKACLGSSASIRYCVMESTSSLFGLNPVGGDYTDYKGVQVRNIIGIGTSAVVATIGTVSADGLFMENTLMWFPGWNNETATDDTKRPLRMLNVKGLKSNNAQPTGANPRRYGGPIDVNGHTGVSNWSTAQRGEGTYYYGGIQNSFEEPGELDPPRDEYGGVPGGTYQKIKEYNTLTHAYRQDGQNFPDMRPIDWVDGTYATGSDPLLDLGPRTVNGGYIQPFWMGWRRYEDPFSEGDPGFVDVATNRPYDLTDRIMPSFKPLEGSAAIKAGDSSYSPLLVDLLGRVRGPKVSIGAVEVDENVFGLPRVE